MTDPTTVPPTPPDDDSSRSRGGSSRKKPLAAAGAMLVILVALGVVFSRSAGRNPGHDAHAHEDAHGAHAHEGTPAPTAVAPVSEEVLRQTDRAARATATGDLARAKAVLSGVLKAAPDHAPALFLQACIALEEGNTAEATAALKKLQAVKPDTAEAALLAKVGALREREPGTTWVQAFRSAWLGMGRPDFQRSALLPGATPLPPDPAEAEAEKAAWARATTDDVKLPLALSMRRLDEEQALWLLKQVPSMKDPGMYLATVDALKGTALPESVHEEARATFRKQLEKLAAAHPRSMQLQLLLLLGDTEEGSQMSAKEVDALERISKLPVWRETSFRDTFEQARTKLKTAGVPDATLLAMSVASRSIMDRGSWILRTRNVGTRGNLPPEGRHRLGRITRDIGQRMTEQPTLVERMAGLQLVRSGAQDLDDESSRVMALSQHQTVEKAIDNFRRTALSRWPLHALTEEWVEASLQDEEGLLHSFEGEAPRSTGITP